mmetsp:Transcript_10422/g.15611  ORF Transcript_10422/g.15611 Transcript_10422/m.15611 type:complete len:94 (-) Transcript_10422:470-751(-)
MCDPLLVFCQLRLPQVSRPMLETFDRLHLASGLPNGKLKCFLMGALTVQVAVIPAGKVTRSPALKLTAWHEDQSPVGWTDAAPSKMYINSVPP